MKYTYYLLIFFSLFIWIDLQGQAKPPDASRAFRPLGSTINRKNFMVGNYSDMRNPFLKVDSTPVSLQPQKFLELSMVNSESDLDKIYSLDATINGKYLFVKGDDELHEYQETKETKYSNTIYFSGKIVLGDRICNNVTMKPSAQALLKSDPQAFARTYGDYYVSTQRLIKKIFVFISVSSLNHSDVDNINGLHHGDLDLGFLALNDNVTIRKNLATAYKSGNCTITFQSFGLFDDSYEQQIRSAVELEKGSQNFDLLSSLSEAFFKILQNDPKQTNYFNETATYSDFVPFGMKPVYYNQIDRLSDRLQQLNEERVKLEDIKGKYDTLRQSNCYLLASDGDKRSIDASLNELNKDKDAFTIKRFDCVTNCQNANLFDCCSFTTRFYKGNSAFNRFWEVYRSFNHSYNFNQTFSAGDTLNFVDLSMPEFIGKRVKIRFKYFFVAPDGGGMGGAHLSLIVNGQVMPFYYNGSFNPLFAIINGEVLPDPRSYQMFETNPIMITGNHLRIAMSPVEYGRMEFNPGYPDPQKIPDPKLSLHEVTNLQGLKIVLLKYSNIEVQVIE